MNIALPTIQVFSLNWAWWRSGVRTFRDFYACGFKIPRICKRKTWFELNSHQILFNEISQNISLISLSSDQEVPRKDILKWIYHCQLHLDGKVILLKLYYRNKKQWNNHVHATFEIILNWKLKWISAINARSTQ